MYCFFLATEFIIVVGVPPHKMQYGNFRGEMQFMAIQLKR